MEIRYTFATCNPI